MSSSIWLEPGQHIQWKGETYRLVRVVDLFYALGGHLETGEMQRIPIKEIEFNPEPHGDSEKESISIDLSLITDEEMAEANRRHKMIEPLLLTADRTRSAVEKVASQEDVSVATLYRWIAAYEKTGKISSLINRRRSDKGQSRLEEEQEHILMITIQENYLTDNRETIEYGYREYQAKCHRAGVPPCSQSTFARRVEEVAPKEKAERRHGKKYARERFGSATENFPGGKFPLQSVQIDHTQPNVILVDDELREPIGRPWVTFAIDIFSRMILGFYLSLSSPSATSVGLCLSNAMMRKEPWLALRGIDTDWPTWGIMDTVYADNGADFRSTSVNRACREYGIRLTWRPLGRPDFGGHVERLMRTVKTDLSNLKGTTFRNPLDRGDYDSEGRAIFTFSEFEHWLTIYITKYYHRKLHSSINLPPIKKYEQGLLYGDQERPTGLPDPIGDERRLYLEFLPFIERTIQRAGVQFDNIYYYHPSIAKWIGVPCPYGNKYLFKYEDHQISHIFFLDPDTQDYLEIPRVRRDAPNMTRYELKKANARIVEQGKAAVDEQGLIEAHIELKEIQEKSLHKSKSARRMKQRKKESTKAVVHVQAAGKLLDDKPQEALSDQLTSGAITPFDDIDGR